jgi:argininosuccinate lyase
LRLCTALLLLAGAVVPATALAAPAHDDFAHLIEINKASLIMLHEQELLTAELARDIARGTARIIDEQAAPGARRSSNYLVFEARLLELAGNDASRLHTGRSRQDIGSTMRRMALREALLATYGDLLQARDALLTLAGQHVDTVIPAYTHGVQAQPTSLAHYLLAFSAAFGRDAERYRQTYARLNQGPLGAAALGTSGFPLDRERLAELLGFDAPIVNSYDANLMSSVDSKIDFAQVMITSAVPVGQLVQNLHTQYHGPAPWFLLSEDQTDVSSIMPQKRNPRPLDRLRSAATAVIGSGQTVVLYAHNTNSGMNDYRDGSQALQTAAHAGEMYRRYVEVIEHLVVSPERALQEIDADYSTMTEVADVLLREANVAFREGHHYASALTTLGRAQGKRPRDLTDDELLQTWREVAHGELPLPVASIRAAMDPQKMVMARRGLGGPQPAEVRRMLAAHRDDLAHSRAWLAGSRKQLTDAAAQRSRLFDALQ